MTNQAKADAGNSAVSDVDRLVAAALRAADFAGYDIFTDAPECESSVADCFDALESLERAAKAVGGDARALSNRELATLRAALALYRDAPLDDAEEANRLATQGWTEDALNRSEIIALEGRLTDIAINGK